MTSTKKQKMMISRSIVDKVRNELNPPGRFLEKDSSTGLWCEVSVKKALEKTAQALRDGAYPLRKQLSEDFSDPSFLAAVFDVNDNMLTSSKPAATVASGPPPTSTNKKVHGHRRFTSAPAIQLPPMGFELPDLGLPDPKRSKPNSPCYSPYNDNDGMNVPMGQHMTGINFPSPTLSQEDLEFNVGTHHPRKDTKKHHRRNRTFGGYSCSDSNISDMPMDDIFALFLNQGDQQAGSQKQQQQQQQHQPIQQNFMTNDSSFFNEPELLQAPIIPSPSRQNNLQSSACTNFEQISGNQAQMMNGTQNFAAQGNFVGGMPMGEDNTVAQLLVSAAASGALQNSNQQQLVHNNAGVPFDQSSMNQTSGMPQTYAAPSSFDQNSMNQAVGIPQTYAAPASFQFQQSHQLDAAGGFQNSMNQNNVMGGIVTTSPAQGIQDQQWLHQNFGTQNATTNGIILGGVPMTQGNAMMHSPHPTPSPGALGQQQFQQNLGGNNVNQCIPQVALACAPPQLQEYSFQDTTMMYSPHSTPSPQVMDSVGIVFQQNNMIQNSAGTDTTQQYSMPLQLQVHGQGNIMVQNSPGAGNTQPFTMSLPSQVQGHGQHVQAPFQLNMFATQSQFSTPTETPDSNTSQTLSGNKRHRRHNTIAGGYCYASHRAPSPVSEQLNQFNLDFLKNLHKAEELILDTPTGEEQNAEMQFHDFSAMAIPELPVQHPKPTPTKGRHRRLNTTGHVGGLESIGLPHDLNFSLNQPAPLNTIQEEIPNMPVAHDCGSMVSSTAGTVDTSKLGLDLAPPKASHEKKPSASSMRSLSVTDPEHNSNKSSLSNEDFFWHMMAGEGSDGEDKRDDLLIVDDEKLINDWRAKESKGDDTNDT